MQKRLFAVVLPVVLACCAGWARAQVITVNCGTDIIDVDEATATVADLPGPDGKISFHEAMVASNNTPGRQTIAFAVPPSEWQMQWYYTNRAAIEANWAPPGSDPVTIDGTTQTAFTGDTNPGGAEVVLMGSGLGLLADDCVVRGLDNTSVTIYGSRAQVVENSVIGLNFYDGSGSLVRNNVGGYVQFNQSNDNVVIGNTLGRVRVLGWFAGDRPARNNRIGGPAATDRNFILGYGVFNTQGFPGGFAVQLFDTDGTILENNSIGTLPDGLTAAHNATTVGVSIESRNTNTLVRNNRIAGIKAFSRPTHAPGSWSGTGIGITGEADGIDIVGNTIGLNANGAPVLGSVNGIDVGTFFSPGLLNIRIGGAAPGQGNVIAGHLGKGILVGREVQNTRLSANSIYGNQDIPVDLVSTLSAYGVTPNDVLDPDTGGNGLQNFPVLQTAETSGANVHVVGSLNSAAARPYSIEFFASPTADSSGYGEGQVFLGATAVTTNASGNASFDVTLPASVAAGWVLSATATNTATGATSEFSLSRTIQTWSILGVGSEPTAGLRLSRATPNPFRGATTLAWALPQAADVSLAIYDVGGRLVRELQSGRFEAGQHEAVWNGLDAHGRPAAAGVYLVRLSAGRQSATGRIALTR